MSQAGTVSPYLAANFGGPVNPTAQPATGPGGALPFQASGNPFSQDLGTAYGQAYQSALGFNQQNYNNILQGYQQTLAQQTSAQQAIGSGYSQLYGNVMQGIQGIGASQSQAIKDAYAQQSGASQQDLINRGLGNSTVLSSVQRGNQLDKQKADVALANQMAQLGAGYASQLGSAGLNYANQAATQNAAQQNAQLGFMNSVQAPYPNSQLYAGLLQQQGAISQANLNRQQAADQFKQSLGAAQGAQARAGMGGSLPPSYPAAPTLGPLGGGGAPSYSPLSSVTPFAGQGMGVGANPNFPISGAAGGANMGASYSDILSNFGGGAITGGFGPSPPPGQQGGGWQNYGPNGELTPGVGQQQLPYGQNEGDTYAEY